MYRDYENPLTLEDRLAELRNEKEEMLKNGCDLDDTIDICIEIHDLEERINFAWQDEYEAM